jgi:hypothetical protein
LTTAPGAAACPTDYTTLKFSDEFNTDGAQILQNGAMI